MLFAIQGIIGLAKEGFKTEETPMGLLISFSRLKPKLRLKLGLVGSFHQIKRAAVLRF